jgi:hypothetical protein
VIAASAFPISSAFPVNPSPSEGDEHRGEGSRGGLLERNLARSRARGEGVFAFSPLCFLVGRGETRAADDRVKPAGFAGVGRNWGVANFLEGRGSGVDVVMVASGRPYLHCNAENAAA